MMSSVTKKSRLPRTATAAHGLRWTRGSRGGSLAGALHSMPAEASSAVVREKDKKTLWRARRATDPPCVLARPSLRCFPKGVKPYFFVLAHTRQDFRGCLWRCEHQQVQKKTITRDICETSSRPRASQLAARRATGLVSNDTSDRIRSFMSVRDKTSRAASDNSKIRSITTCCVLRSSCCNRTFFFCASHEAPTWNSNYGSSWSASVWMQGLRQHQRKKRSTGVWWQRLTHKLGGDTSGRKLLPTATRHNQIRCW